MPANLPPEYHEAEKRFREAHGPREKIDALEALISTIPKHKGTDRLRADLRRRLSKLRQEGDRSRKGGRGDLYAVQKEGAAQVALVGFPNAGKSALMAALTNASPVVADYPMSTVMPFPGMMPFEDVLIQLVDLPPIGFEFTDGWVSGIIRNADVLLLVLDLSEEAGSQAELLLEQLDRWRIAPRRLLMGANKMDAPGARLALESLTRRYGGLCPVVGVSARTKDGLEDLRGALFRVSGVIRVYSKQPGREADMSRPFTVCSGTTVQDLARKIHKDFVSTLKFARVWGSVKIQGQKVTRDHVLGDRDVVELHL